MSPEILALTVALGALGAVLRYIIQSAWMGGARRYGAIVMVNILGSAIAGAAVALPESPLTLPLIVGLCGGLTTFSTLVLHLLPVPHSPVLWRRVSLGVAHVVGSVAACALAFEGVSSLV